MDTPTRYRSKAETIQYFGWLASEFDKRAARTDSRDEETACWAKADAYRLAAFEIEHNADWGLTDGRK